MYNWTKYRQHTSTTDSSNTIEDQSLNTIHHISLRIQFIILVSELKRPNKDRTLYYKSRDREFVFTLQVDIDHLNYHHIEESCGHHDEHHHDETRLHPVPPTLPPLSRQIAGVSRFGLGPSGVPFVTVTAESVNLSPTLLLVVVDSGNLTLVHDIPRHRYAVAKRNVSTNSQTIHKQYISMQQNNRKRKARH